MRLRQSRAQRRATRAAEIVLSPLLQYNTSPSPRQARLGQGRGTSPASGGRWDGQEQRARPCLIFAVYFQDSPV